MTNLDFVVNSIVELLEEAVDAFFAEQRASASGDAAEEAIGDAAEGAPEGQDTQANAPSAAGEEVASAPRPATQAEILKNALPMAEAIARRLCETVPGIRAIVEGPHHIMEAYPTVFLSEAEVIVEASTETHAKAREDGIDLIADMFLSRIDALRAHMRLCRTINDEADGL